MTLKRFWIICETISARLYLFLLHKIVEFLKVVGGWLIFPNFSLTCTYTPHIGFWMSLKWDTAVHFFHCVTIIAQSFRTNILSQFVSVVAKIHIFSTTFIYLFNKFLRNLNKVFIRWHTWLYRWDNKFHHWNKNQQET